MEERQRIGLVRAFYGNPRILVLDEPNASLVSEGEMSLEQALLDARERGTTVIISTHRMSIAATCDRVLTLREGTIASFGPPEEVLRMPPREIKGSPPSLRRNHWLGLRKVGGHTQFRVAVIMTDPSSNWTDQLQSNRNRLSLFGYLLIVFLIWGFVSWSATMPLARAVIADGKIAAVHHNIHIQHLEGGLVEKVNVREGDYVRAGTILYN